MISRLSFLHLLIELKFGMYWKSILNVLKEYFEPATRIQVIHSALKKFQDWPKKRPYNRVIILIIDIKLLRSLVTIQNNALNECMCT